MAASSEIVIYHPRYAHLAEEEKALLFEPEKLKEAELVTRELVGRGIIKDVGLGCNI